MEPAAPGKPAHGSKRNGEGALQALQCQRGGSRLLGRLLHPVPGARTRRLLGRVYNKKSCSKNLLLVRTCPAPLERAGDSDGHRTPTTKELVTESGGSAGAAQHPGKRSRGSGASSRAAEAAGEPRSSHSGTGTSGD